MATTPRGKGKQRRRRPRAGSVNYCMYKNPTTGKTEKLQALGGSHRFYVISEIESVSESGIYKCFDKQTGQLVCIKSQRFSTFTYQNQPFHETAVMEYCKKRARESEHPGAKRIVKIVDSYVDEELGNHYIVTPFALFGDAFMFTRDIPRGSLNYRTLISGFIYDILMAVHFIHSIGVYHRDIKLENFLVYWDREEGREMLKLCDFGFATMGHPEEERVRAMGSLLYCAPELLLPANFNRKYLPSDVDVWAMCTCLFALIQDCFPFVDFDIEDDRIDKDVIFDLASSIMANLYSGPVNRKVRLNVFKEDYQEWMKFFDVTFQHPSVRPTIEEIVEMKWPAKLIEEQENRRKRDAFALMISSHNAMGDLFSMMPAYTYESRSTETMAISVPASSSDEEEEKSGSMSSRPSRNTTSNEPEEGRQSSRSAFHHLADRMRKVKFTMSFRKSKQTK